MNRHGPRSWPFSKIQVFSGILVIAGITLASWNWWAFILVALGAFGPGILRECGWLHDKDEFQLQADRRAGFHAFLVTGVVSVILIACQRASDFLQTSHEGLATLVFTVLWVTWVFSALLDFWGPKKTARRILACFGIGWMVFAIASNVGNEWQGWQPLVLHSLLPLPFLVIAVTVEWIPRISSLILLGMSAYLIHFFGWFQRDNMSFANQAITFVLFVVPLIGCGIALLFVKQDSEEQMDDKALDTGKT